MVERVSGISFPEYLDKNIFNHLGVTETPSDHFDRSKLARVYFSISEKTLPNEFANLIASGGFIQPQKI